MSLETSGATGLSPMTSATSQGPASPEHSPRSKAPEGRQLARRPSSAHLTSVGEIDEIFDAYDEVKPACCSATAAHTLLSILLIVLSMRLALLPKLLTLLPYFDPILPGLLRSLNA